MAPQKRKKPHDVPPEVIVVQPRRPTRQHPSPDEQESGHILRSGRMRAHTAEKEKENVTINGHAPIETTTAASRGRRKDASRTTRHTSTSDKPLKENIQPNDGDVVEVIEIEDDEEDEEREANEERNEPIRQRHSRHTQQNAQTSIAPSMTRSPPPQTRLIPPKSSSHQPKQETSARSAHTAQISTPKRPASSSDRHLKPPPTPRSDRNIDKVVLGNISFKSWYPSYYGKDVLGDPSGNNVEGGGKNGAKVGGKVGGGKKAPYMLERLYVCPYCFKYAKDLTPWWTHVKVCETSFELPGRKVYTHPKGVHTKVVKAPGAVAAETAGKSKGKKRGDVHGGDTVSLATEQVVHDEGEWSVWEVDGEKDKLFCQNLSLFAKLFLDNKSVFFDVTGFNYFLLVYTPPPRPKHTTQTPPSPPLASSTNDQPSPQQLLSPSVSEGTKSQAQVVGFFSKEKLSWDNNNLACILVFPPWQRKGLGALLMGVSYDISRREGILGGPEKPISELGRKGYKRYWAGEIARWLLGLEIGGANEEKEEKEKETLVTIEQCSKATWIVPEDCLAVLREMGLVEDAGLGPASEPLATTGAADNHKHGHGTGGKSEVVVDEEMEGEDAKTKVMVPRVRLDKEAVRRWVAANKIDLRRACDPEGFVEGYAVKDVEGADMDED